MLTMAATTVLAPTYLFFEQIINFFRGPRALPAFGETPATACIMRVHELKEFTKRHLQHAILKTDNIIADADIDSRKLLIHSRTHYSECERLIRKSKPFCREIRLSLQNIWNTGRFRELRKSAGSCLCKGLESKLMQNKIKCRAKLNHPRALRKLQVDRDNVELELGVLQALMRDVVNDAIPIFVRLCM